MVVAQNQTRTVEQEVITYKSIWKELGDIRTLQSTNCPAFSRYVITLDIPCILVIDLIIQEQGRGQLNPN